MLFLSVFTNKVDKKGRVSVPAAFRQGLRSQDFQGIVAYPSFVNPCIEACGFDRIARISESIDNMDPYSEERDAFATAILGGCQQLSFDNDGRVLMTSELTKAAKITDKALFIGKGSTFEIWEPEIFAEYSNKAKDLAKKSRHMLRLVNNLKEGEK
jgi:MraZ protein